MIRTDKSVQKLMIILPNDNLGGAEQYLKMMAEHYLKLNYEVDVFFLKKKVSGSWDYLQGTKFRVHFTKRKTEKYGALSLLFKLIGRRRKRYDLVFTSHIHVNSFVSLLRRMNIIRSRYHVARESTSIFARYTGVKLAVFKFHYNLNYHSIDLLICQTDFMLKQLKEGLPSLFEKINIKVIPNPIDIQALAKPATEKQDAVSNYIVSAGRLIPEKGFDILIESFAAVSKNFPDLALVILGEGGMRTTLQKRVKELDLSEKVFLPGFINNVYPYFRQARACVVSSRIEGFPNVLLQMMSQNSAVVSTLCAGGIEEIPSIYTCEPGSVEKLAYQIEQSLTLDNSKNELLFESFLEKRSLSSFVEQLEEYLDA